MRYYEHIDKRIAAAQPRPRSKQRRSLNPHKGFRTMVSATQAETALAAYAAGDITQIQALTADRSKIVMHKDSRQPGYVSAWFNVMASNNATGKSEQIDVYMPLLGIDAVAMAQRTINAAYKGCYVVVSAQMQENTPF